jgi:hypothetical protein
MICSTFRVLLNEIYWMANDTQVKAAMGTYSTISKLMTKSFAQKRKYATLDSQQQQTATTNVIICDFILQIYLASLSQVAL